MLVVVATMIIIVLGVAVLITGIGLTSVVGQTIAGVIAATFAASILIVVWLLTQSANF